MTMTDERIAAIQARLEAIEGDEGITEVVLSPAEYTLLLAAPDDIAALLAEVERLREREKEATVYACTIPLALAEIPIPELAAKYMDKLLFLLTNGQLGKGEGSDG